MCWIDFSIHRTWRDDRKGSWEKSAYMHIFACRDMHNLTRMMSIYSQCVDSGTPSAEAIMIAFPQLDWLFMLKQNNDADGLSALIHACHWNSKENILLPEQVEHSLLAFEFVITHCSITCPHIHGRLGQLLD
jgi:hypothetical protein